MQEQEQAAVALTALREVLHDGKLYGPGRPAGESLTASESDAQRLELSGAVKRDTSNKDSAPAASAPTINVVVDTSTPIATAVLPAAVPKPLAAKKAPAKKSATKRVAAKSTPKA